MKKLDVTYINQNPDYPTGCETISTIMCMRYLGIDVDIRDFIERISGSEINKKTVEALIKSGALDCLSGTRKQYMNVFQELMDEASKKNRDRMLTEIKSMLHKTELEEEILSRKISELSGGQRQRIAIALTLIQKKSLIILDEPVSALDVTIQEQILELLMKLKKAFGLTYILISHDMRLVSRVCDEVYTIEEGKLCKG